MSPEDSSPAAVEPDSQDTQEVNTPGDDNVIVEVAPADVIVNVELPDPTPDPEPPSTEPGDLSSLVGAAITAAVAPLVESVNSLADRVLALETGPVNTLDEVPPVVVEEPVVEVSEDEDSDQNLEDDAPPKSRRDHWFFRDHDVPLLHKTG